MGKLERTIKSEIARLAEGEAKRLSLSLRRDVRALRISVLRLRRSVSTLERLLREQRRQLQKRRATLLSSSEEEKKLRLSARLIRNLRKRLGITQKEMATLAGVTVGAVYQWEQGKFAPREKKKEILVGLRTMGRRAVRKLLAEKHAETGEERRAKGRRKRVRK